MDFEGVITRSGIGLWSRMRRVKAKKVLSFVRHLPLGPTFILFLLLFSAIFANVLAPADPTESHLADALTPPVFQKGGSFHYILGSDHLGRDILSRILHGSRVSLIVGFTAVFIAGTIGTTFALVSGYFGGWADTIIMRLTDAFMSMPFLMIAIAMAAIMGASLRNIIIILGVFLWAGYARVIRSEVLRLREADFIRLAVVAGASRPRILFRHLFPNVVNTLVVLATLQLGVTIIAEASLSFLGLGVPPPAPSWGSMLADGRRFVTTAWWLSVFPGLAIMFTVLACNLMGDWLRVRLDPKFRQL